MYIALFCFITLFYVMIGLIFLSKKNEMKKRIEAFIPDDPRKEMVEGTQPTQKKESKYKHLIENLATFINTKQSKRMKWEQKLDSAGVLLKPEEFMIIRIIISLVIGAISNLFISNGYIGLIIATLCWGLIPNYLKIKLNKRLEKSASQLPPTLETMATAMKSGFSFIQSMQIVAKDIPDPIGPEFNRVIHEINLGISMEEAFDNLLMRLPNKDLEMLISAILIQRTTGGNLSQILDTIKETITERIRMKEELKALTAQGKMSAWVISLLPIIIGLVLNLINSDYFGPMFSHPLGWGLLAGGTFSGIIGWVLIQKIVGIEV
jgi:tight adherence protein B